MAEGIRAGAWVLYVTPFLIAAAFVLFWRRRSGATTAPQ
jgi:hypothetical protein